jgi:hypothetical protein
MVLKEHNAEAATNLQSNQLPATRNNPANNVKPDPLTLNIIRDKAHLPEREITRLGQGIKRPSKLVNDFGCFGLGAAEVEISGEEDCQEVGHRGFGCGCEGVCGQDA